MEIDCNFHIVYRQGNITHDIWLADHPAYCIVPILYRYVDKQLELYYRDKKVDVEKFVSNC